VHVPLACPCFWQTNYAHCKDSCSFTWIYRECLVRNSYENNRCPACYVWIRDDKIIYAGETGIGTFTRMNAHLSEIRLNLDDGPMTKKRAVFGHPNTESIQVYCPPLPVFFNSLVPPAFQLFHCNKTARLLEESAVVHFYLPFINKQD
jgi:hypothetical protein